MEILIILMIFVIMGIINIIISYLCESFDFIRMVRYGRLFGYVFMCNIYRFLVEKKYKKDWLIKYILICYFKY